MDEKRTILFVDDEERILDCIQWGLKDEPYDCLFATNGRQALNLFENHEIHVICTDMQMPEMDGLTLLKRVKERYPHTVRLVLSSNTQVGTLLTAINQGEIFKFITKPWRMQEEGFKSIIHQAIEHYNLNAEHDRPAAETSASAKAHPTD